VQWIPASGFTGENLLERFGGGWFEGYSLVEAIDNFIASEKDINGPLRFPVTDVYKSHAACCVTGRIESGAVQVGQEIIIMPSKTLAIIKSVTLLTLGIEMNDEQVQWAVSGDRVSMLVPVEELIVPVGSIICDDVPPILYNIMAHVSSFDSNLTMGMPLLFHHLSTSTPCRLVKIMIDGKVKRSLPPFKVGRIELFIEKGVVVDSKSDGGKALKRFTIRSMGVSVAAGLIVS
jgi:elongation factor 1 alpha-like protein